MKPTFTLASDSVMGVYALYDENNKLIHGWQYGDDISRVMRVILAKVGHDIKTVDIKIDGDFPQTLR